MAPIPRLRPYSGPSLFSYGFRPFFLFGALYAGLAISIWLPLFYGSLALRTAFTPLDWHVHEMLYGYLPAVVTGFLLTAIPNWTGRLPLQGGPLVFLLAVWAAGRLVVLISAEIGWLTAAIIDSSFLFVVVAAAAREIMAGRNWANLKVLLPLSTLGLGNLGFHIEAHFRGTADYSIRIGIAAVVVLIMLIGGRIIPSFTRNWLVRDNPGRLPICFQPDGCHLDRIERNRTAALDDCAIWMGDRDFPFVGCCYPDGKTRTMGRRPDFARASRSDSPCRLWLCATRLRFVCAWRCGLRGAERRSSRLDGRRGRPDDPCRHDAREPWTYRA